MRLASFADHRVGVVDHDHVTDVTALLSDAGAGVSAMRWLIAHWDTMDLTSGDTPRVPLANVRLDPPVPDPTKIIAAPVNYADHQAEMRVDAQVGALGFFLKAPSSILGTGGTVRLPYHDRRFDQEGELGCVIGRRARQVPVDQALRHVFGYTAVLDITMRGGEDRSTRKSFETFTPIGPWLVTADEFGTPEDTDLRCWVNDELRQEANTRDLIWDVAQLVSYASWVTTLEPGDIISTGTPAGVGPLRDGDTIEVEISGLGGRLRVDVSGACAVASHTSGHGQGPVAPPEHHHPDTPG